MKKKEKVVKDTAERWLLTYADLMNLLLIFFIILYAMSQVDQSKAEELAKSMNEAFGFNNNASKELFPQGSGSSSIIDLGNGNLKPTPTPLFPSSGNQPGGNGNTEDQEMADLKNEIDGLIKDKNLAGLISANIQERGVRISIMAQYLFASGSASLEQSVTSQVIEIGNMLKEFPDNYIRVEGHTDNVPINTAKFPSNWELSSARATNVLRTLVQKCSIDPKHISAVGYGEFQPIVPNDSDVNKAKNRRIDIIVLKKDFSVGEAGQND